MEADGSVLFGSNDVGAARSDAGDLHDDFLVLRAAVANMTGGVHCKPTRWQRRRFLRVERVASARPPSALQHDDIARFGMPMRTAHGMGRELDANQIEAGL